MSSTLPHATLQHSLFGDGLIGENGDYAYRTDRVALEAETRHLNSPNKLPLAGSRYPPSHAPSSRDSHHSSQGGRRLRPENGGADSSGPSLLGNGTHIQYDPRLFDTNSSGSEKQSSAPSTRSRQQMLDKWRLDQKNPIHSNERVLSPQGSRGSTAAHAMDPQPSIDIVGELFNFTQPANLAPKFAPGGPLPPELPSWNSQRPFLTGQYLCTSAETRPPPEAHEQPLSACTRQSQDNLVVDDLLNTFLGLEGKYIRVRLVKRAEGLHITFSLDCQLDSSIRDMANRLLPLSEYAVVVERFVETRSAFEWGLVCHALAGAMRELLEDWRLLVTQLEHQHLTGRLNLPTLWYHCQKPLTTLQLVASIAGEAAARKLRGAQLLNLLHQKSAAVAGDVEATFLVQKLLQAASQPYFSLLELWLCQGVLNDPYAEFMVEEDKAVGHDSINNDHDSAYWTDRYTLRMRQNSLGGVFASTEPLPDMPAFLDSCKDLILTTGKYLNIIRECGKEVVRPLPSDIHLVYDKEQSYLHHIRAANKAASAAVLDLIQKDLGLPAVLLALKHYFLLDRGDLLMSFLDTAEDEMAKPLQHVSLPRLQTLLDLAVRSSSGMAEPKGEELFCTIDTRRLQPMLHDLAPRNFQNRKYKQTPLRRQSTVGSTADEDAYALMTQLGREVFMLGFKVMWPMNVVVTTHSMNTYQLIFRHLFELKCVERELNKVWKIYQRARYITRDTDGALKRAYGLCQRMMHFFHQYLLYVTFEVLEPHWLSLQNAVRTANTLDEIIDHHKTFLNRALAGTVLKSKMVRNLTELKVLVYDFASQSERLDLDAALLEPEALDCTGKAKNETQKRNERAKTATQRIQDILASGLFSDKIRDMDSKFDQSLGNFISGLEDVYKAASSKADSSREEAESLLNLISRLDFNGYFAAVRPHVGSSLLGPLPRLKIY